MKYTAWSKEDDDDAAGDGKAFKGIYHHFYALIVFMMMVKIMTLKV